MRSNNPSKKIFVLSGCTTLDLFYLFLLLGLHYLYLSEHILMRAYCSICCTSCKSSSDSSGSSSSESVVSKAVVPGEFMFIYKYTCTIVVLLD